MRILKYKKQSLHKKCMLIAISRLHLFNTNSIMKDRISEAGCCPKQQPSTCLLSSSSTELFQESHGVNRGAIRFSLIQSTP